MARPWFRHDAMMRYDDSVRAMRVEFGPIGDLAWRCLLEVLAQAESGSVRVHPDELAGMFAFPRTWKFDGLAWLRAGAKRGLFRLRPNRDSTYGVTVERWEKYQPEFETPSGVRKRKATSRGQKSPGSHSDNPVTTLGQSQATYVTNEVPPNPHGFAGKPNGKPKREPESPGRIPVFDDDYERKTEAVRDELERARQLREAK